MAYVCDICTHSFTLKTDLKRHVNRKNKCKIPEIVNDMIKQIQKQENISVDIPSNVPLNISQEKKKENVSLNKYNNFICKLCKKIFKRKNNLVYHIVNSCEYKNVNIIMDEVKKKNKSDNVISNTDKNNHIQQNITNNINTTIINNTTNNNLMLNFNSHVRDIEFTDIDLSNILKNQIANIVPTMVERVHFDSNKPENHNIYLPVRRSNTVIVFNNDRYVSMILNDAICNLDTKMKDHLGKFVDRLEENNNTNLSPKEIKMVCDRVDRLTELEDKDDLQIRSNQKVKMLLYDNKDMVKETKKRNENIKKMNEKNNI